MLADISSRRSSNLCNHQIAVDARPSPPHFYCFYIYSCLFPCKTAREYFLAVLFLFEIS